jgi:plasmid stability protein
MPQLLMDNLPNDLLHQLEVLAEAHGRSVQAEVQHILQQAVEASAPEPEWRSTIAQVQALYAGETFGDSADLIRADRDRR